MRFHLLLVAAFLVAAPVAVRGQDTRGLSGIVIVSPEQAVAAALAGSPALRGAGAVQQAVRGDALQARLRPNPDLSAVVENFGGFGGTGNLRGGRAIQTTVGASQRIELGGKRGARIGLAGEANTVAGLDFTLARLDLARDVVTALADAVASARLVDIELERARLAEETVRVARGRVEAGRDPLVQQRRAEVTRTTALIASERARREAEVSLRTLTVLLGIPQVQLAPRQPWFDEVRPSRPELARATLAGANQESLADNPDLARLDAVVVQRRANLMLQRANAVPDVTVQGYVRRVEESRETAFVAGVAVPLPIFDRNQGGIARAQAELLQAEVETERGRLAIMASLTTAERRLDLARRSAQALRTEAVPAAEQAARFATGGFAAGKFTYLEVLDAQRALSDVRAQLNDALREFHTRRAETERLRGQDVNALPAGGVR